MLAKHADARGNGLSFELKLLFARNSSKFHNKSLTPGLSFLAKRILNISDTEIFSQRNKLII